MKSCVSLNRPRLLSNRRQRMQIYALGEKLQDWVKSPIQLATFGPRITIGALLAAPERLQNLQSDLTKVQEVLSGSMSNNEKANIILEEIEIRMVDCLERGATLETDVYQNLRSALPENLKQNLPEQPPFVPNFSEKEKGYDADRQYESDSVTYDSSSVAKEKQMSETTGLYDAIVAVKTAQSAVKTNTSQAREKMLKMNLKEERDFLITMLSEIDVRGSEMDSLVTEANQLIEETENFI